MLFGVTADAEDAAGHIDLAVEEAEGRNRKLMWKFGMAWVPLGWIPGNMYPV